MPKDFSIDVADFINRLLEKKSNQRLGSRGIDEIKDHSWLEDIDWNGIELKNLDESQIPFIPFLKDEDKDIQDVNDNKKIDKYNAILDALNRENIFNNFYFNFNEKNKKTRNIIGSNADEYDDNEEEEND